MRQKMANRPSPSTRAASSSSPGRAMKNWRMMKVASTLGAPKIGTRISGQWVLTMPQRVEHLEQRHDRHLARDQQAGEHDEEQRVGAGETDPREGVAGQRRRPPACPTVTTAAMYMLLTVLLREGLQREHLAGRRPGSRRAGSSGGGKAKMSLIGLTDDVTIHQVGNTNGTSSTHSSP